jgi:hypothetical protein
MTTETTQQDYCFVCHGPHPTERHCSFCGKLFTAELIEKHEEECQNKNPRKERGIDRHLLDWQQVGPILLEAIEDIDWAFSSRKPKEAGKIVEQIWKRMKSMERTADA